MDANGLEASALDGRFQCSRQSSPESELRPARSLTGLGPNTRKMIIGGDGGGRTGKNVAFLRRRALRAFNLTQNPCSLSFHAADHREHEDDRISGGSHP